MTASIACGFRLQLEVRCGATSGDSLLKNPTITAEAAELAEKALGTILGALNGLGGFCRFSTSC